MHATWTTKTGMQGRASNMHVQKLLPHSRPVLPACLVVLERTRRFVLVICSRSTKHGGRNILNSRSGLEYPPFACSLDSYTVSTAFKRWILWTSSGVQEPMQDVLCTMKQSRAVQIVFFLPMIVVVSMSMTNDVHAPASADQSTRTSMRACMTKSNMAVFSVVLLIPFSVYAGFQP